MWQKMNRSCGLGNRLTGQVGLAHNTYCPVFQKKIKIRKQSNDLIKLCTKHTLGETFDSFDPFPY